MEEKGNVSKIEYKNACAATGEREDLCQHAFRNKEGFVIGYIFLQEGIDTTNLDVIIKGN